MDNFITDTAMPTLSDRFVQAMSFAAQLHANQLRKGTHVPYIAHLLGVTSLALEYGATEDEAIAALLHDAIEDQGGAATREEIRRQFGDTVTQIVEGCTDADTVPKPPWKERKQAYIQHIPLASASVRLVSACDKLHNARSIVRDCREQGEAVWDKFKGGKAGTLWYYRALITAFRQGEPMPVIEELDRVVTEMEALSHPVPPA